MLETKPFIQGILHEYNFLQKVLDRRLVDFWTLKIIFIQLLVILSKIK